MVGATRIVEASVGGGGGGGGGGMTEGTGCGGGGGGGAVTLRGGGGGGGGCVMNSDVEQSYPLTPLAAAVAAAFMAVCLSSNTRGNFPVVRNRFSSSLDVCKYVQSGLKHPVLF